MRAYWAWIRCEAFELLSAVFQLMYFIVWAGVSCGRLHLFWRCSRFAAFSTLRVYAVTHCNWKPALLTLLLGLVPFATNIVSAVILSLRVWLT